MRKYFFELERQTFKVPLRFINKFLVKTTMEIHQKKTTNPLEPNSFAARTGARGEKTSKYIKHRRYI